MSSRNPPPLAGLLVRIVAAALLPVLAGAAAMAWWMYDQGKQQLAESMSVAACAVSHGLDERFARDAGLQAAATPGIVLASLPAAAPRLAPTLDAGKLGELLSRHKMPSNWVATLLDEQGHVVARTHDGARWLRTAYPAHLPPGQMGPLLASEGIGGYARSPVTGWSVVVEAGRGESWGQLEQALVALAAGLLLLAAASLWLVRRYTAAILDSLQMLVVEARQAAMGLPVDLPRLAFREANQFAKAIDAAAHEVHKSTMALERSEHQLRAVLETAMDAVVVIDRKGCIVLFNKGAERMFGTPHDEMIGKPIELLMPERYRSAHASMVRRFAGEQGFARQMGVARLVHGQRANGEEFPVEASISSARADGEQWMTVIMRDVSTLHRPAQAPAATTAGTRPGQHVPTGA